MASVSTLTARLGGPSTFRQRPFHPCLQCFEADVSEAPIGGRRVERVDVVIDPEAELAPQQLAETVTRRWLEARLGQLCDRGIHVLTDRLKSLCVPLGPVTLALSV